MRRIINDRHHGAWTEPGLIWRKLLSLIADSVAGFQFAPIVVISRVGGGSK